MTAIFLRLPGLAPDRRGSKEGDHPTIYIIYIASDRCEIRRLTVGLAGARPNKSTGNDYAVAASLAVKVVPYRTDPFLEKFWGDDLEIHPVLAAGQAWL